MLTVIPDTVFPALPVLPKIFHLISQCRSKEILPILPISLEIMQHPKLMTPFSSPHIHEKDIEVRDYLYSKFDEALRNSIQMAIQNRSICTIEYGVGQCFINVNRNVETKEGYWIGQNNAGYSNRDVRVLLIKKENQCIANIINYDLQCSVFY